MSGCHLSLLSLACAAATLAACAGSTRSPASEPGPKVDPTCAPFGPPSSTLGAEELRAAPFPDLLRAIQRIRPRFLETRVPRGDRFAVVYVDGMRWGDVLRLRDIPVIDVVEVVFLGPSDATTRFGTGHTGGALLVRTRAGPAQRAEVHPCWR